MLLMPSLKLVLFSLRPRFDALAEQGQSETNKKLLKMKLL